MSSIHSGNEDSPVSLPNVTAPTQSTDADTALPMGTKPVTSRKENPSHNFSSENTSVIENKPYLQPDHEAYNNASVAQLPRRVGKYILGKVKTLAARTIPLSSRHGEVRAGTQCETPNPGDSMSENISASLEAHQLVREITSDQSDPLATVRRQSARPIESGLRRRESGGGILAQLLSLHIGQNQPPHDALPSGEAPAGAQSPISLYDNSASYRPDADSNLKRQEAGHSVPLEDELRVTINIADIIQRRRYIIQLCRALMRFGAPMHRLEEHMRTTATVLDVDSQFLYVPGCMIMSFDDPVTRTTEVKLVRVEQGINLGLLEDTHHVYKSLIHNDIEVKRAADELERILNSKPRFNKWIVIVVYGLASAMVGPFAFNARPIDMPMIFLNGSILGVLHHVIAPRSVLYSNVFEVTAAVLTSFISRGLGSIQWNAPDGNREHLFCFSAIAQSSIALILPGYTVLSSSLELQSHQLVSGSIRMVYAFIYSLFLGYGITVGTTIYGLIDPDAADNTSCPRTGDFPDEYSPRFPFVAAFVLCLLVINQGRWKQAPVMLFIAEAGYVVTYFVTQRLGTSTQVANTVGAFTIGLMGNLYSRLWHGHAATSILPGIFVLVPSGLAASGPLISGIKSSSETRNNLTSAVNHSGYSIYSVESSQIYTADLGFGMVEVSIGITVGLFLAALLVYPFGKRRSGLFSF